jgi:Ca2+-dependent lipid-binding protein
VAVSFSKFNKPVYSTRTIIDTQDPVWEEPAFVLVTSDSIEAGERLRIRVVDSDRFSADDAMGRLEIDLADLVDQSIASGDQLHRRQDPLKADRPGMKTSGHLNWSVRFCPLWQMQPEEMMQRMQSIKEARRRAEPSDLEPPWWLKMIQEIAVDKPDWENERAERRKETLAWFTGERERDEMEAAVRPSDDLRSGILQFHVHQCTGKSCEIGAYESS